MSSVILSNAPARIRRVRPFAGGKDLSLRSFAAPLLRTTIFLLIMIPVSSAFAFFPKSQPKKGDVALREHADYLLLYQLTDRVENRETSSGKKKKWREVSFKLTSRAENLSKLFAGANVGSIELLDEDGFTVESALVHLEDFNAGAEAYGFLWAEEKRARKIRSAKFRPLKDSAETSQIPPAPVDIKQGSEPVEMAARHSDPEQREGEESRDPSPPEDPFVRKGVTTEEVTESLKEYEDKKGKGMALEALFKEGPTLQEMIKKEIQKQE